MTVLAPADQLGDYVTCLIAEVLQGASAALTDDQDADGAVCHADAGQIEARLPVDSKDVGQLPPPGYSHTCSYPRLGTAITGLTYPEVAEFLGEAVPTVEDRIRAGLTRLAVALSSPSDGICATRMDRM